MSVPTTPTFTINWHEYPFVRLLLPVLLGVVLAENLDCPDWIAGLFLGIGSTATLVFSALRNVKSIWFGVATSISLVSLAYLYTNQYNEQNRSDHFSQFQLEESAKVVGWIASMPEEKKWVQFRFQVLQIGDQSASGNIQIYVEKDNLSQQLSYGDVLQIDANLLRASTPKNPNAFDFSKYLHYQNTHYQSFVRKTDWKRLISDQGNSVLRSIYHLRKKLLNMLSKHLEAEEVFSVGAALTLGYRGAISEEVRNAYANTGAIHILAVSGLHVGIIAMILFWILKVIPSYTFAQKCLKAGIALSGIWLFTLLTGASASVLRAATMFSFIIVGKYVQRNGTIYNSLAAAAFCSLLYNPYLLFQVGFQLSYLAVAGIVFFQPKIHRLIYIKSRPLDYLWQITSVSFAAQIAVFPISLYYFHQFPTYFWLSSMIVIPAAFIILLLAIFLFFSQLLLPIMSDIGGEILEGLLYVMNQIIFAIERLPFGLIEGVWIAWYDVLFWYGFIAAITLVLLHRKAKFMIATVVIFCLLSGSYTIKKTQQYFNKSMVVYHNTRETVIDFFDGYTAYSLQVSNVDQKRLDFATQQHRWAMGSKTIQTHFLKDTISLKYDHIWMNLPYLQFYDKRIMLLNHHQLIQSEEKLKLDYLLIYDSPSLKMVDVLKAIEPQLIILDASNRFSQIKQWKMELEELNIAYYNVHELGAFEIQIE
ncbi:MAG: ComEC/Rec2 family competence protein [Bacteroidota bacterium]